MSLSISPPLVLVIFCVFLIHSSFLVFSTNLPAPYSCFPVDTNPVHYRCFDNNLQTEIPAFSLPQIRSYPPPKTRTWVSAFGRINTIATVMIIFITLLNVIVYKLRQHQELNSGEKLTLSSSLPSEQLCRRFSLSEILSATHNFDESLVIGQGGFGKVYKGVVDNGASTVAIKRLSSLSKQGAGEFWTEITMLSKFRHSHLVSLLGYCDYSEMILVYEYMDNGTLADHLYKLAKKGVPYSPLYWIQRLQICIGAARGIDYLHTGTGIRQRVIHRDVKSTNILLDENWAAKISDFGMSKISPANQSFTHISTLVKGTFGYVDPEYFLTRRLTRKSDVYSFGVVLLEVLCGRPAVDSSLQEDQRGLARWAQNCIKEGKVDYIVDPTIRVLIQSNCLSAYVQIAEQCLDPLPKKRPTMAEVVAWLEFSLSLQEKGESDSSLLNDSFFKTFDTTTESQEHEGSSANKEIISGDNGGNDDDDDNDDDNDNDNGNDVETPVKQVFDGGKNETESAVINPVKKESFTKKVKLLFVSPRRFLSEKLKGMGNCYKKTNSNIQSNSSFSSQAGIHLNPSADRNSKNEVVQLVPPSRNQLIPNSLAEKYDPKRSKNSSKSILGNEEVVPQYGQLVDAKLKKFSFAELKIATSNFGANTVLGEGGFGRVYKGWVNEKTLEPTKPNVGFPVAIKKFNPEGLQGFEEWQAEVNFLGRCIHPNLVKLLGYCYEKKNRDLLVVYEFMSKGSLETYIFRRNKELLSWTTRLKIATGAAKGLAFLHSLEVQIIYRDFKSSNILLDDDFNPKLSDFGFAKSGPAVEFSHVSTRVVGTFGYAAPEYIATGHLYVKSDVYSFGVVLLEMLTGLRALDVNRSTGEHNLVAYAVPLLANKRKLTKLVDSRLELNYPLDSAFVLAKLVGRCLKAEPKDRPSMIEVVEILEQLQKQ